MNCFFDSQHELIEEQHKSELEEELQYYEKVSSYSLTTDRHGSAFFFSGYGVGMRLKD